MRWLSDDTDRPVCASGGNSALIYAVLIATAYIWIKKQDGQT
jgi:hypothetical protein